MLNIVIARYKEDVAWINTLPENVRVYLYNKGPDIPEGTLRPGVRIERLPNTGRESGTYIHHLRHNFKASEGEFTVFTQADPFEHAPAFLHLLRCPELWRDIQPMSLQWIEEKKIPPTKLLADDQRDWIGDLPIRTEHFSLHTWAPLSFFDEGAWGIGQTYRQKHMLPSGTNIIEHFFELCGLDWLAERARGTDVGLFSYGAIFAVRNRLIADFVERARPHLEKIDLLTRADLNYGYIFERCWMHLFGEPFVRFDAIRSGAVERAMASPAVAASLPRVLPPEAAPQQAVATSSADTSSTQVSIDMLRTQAYQALGRGDSAQAVALLNRALLADPMNVEVLSDLAALAFQSGEGTQAIPFARRALLVDPNHGASRFTLGMCLSGTGQVAEALALFTQLLGGESGRVFKAENPDLAGVAEAELARLQTLCVAA